MMYLSTVGMLRLILWLHWVRDHDALLRFHSDGLVRLIPRKSIQRFPRGQIYKFSQSE